MTDPIDLRNAAERKRLLEICGGLPCTHSTVCLECMTRRTTFPAALDLIGQQQETIAELKIENAWLWSERIEVGRLLGVDLSRANDRLQDVVAGRLYQPDENEQAARAAKEEKSNVE